MSEAAIETGGAARATRYRPWPVYAGVFAVAATLRFLVIGLSAGGLRGNFDYDPSVYYAAADALTFGRLPYRDFTLLHPPGLMLVLTPFAAIGRVTSDHAGFMTATCCFVALGAANAMLVVAVVRRAGLSLRAAAVGGLFYAIWFGAIDAEYTVRLEPAGSAAFLCGLLALVSPRLPSRRASILGGVALGVALSVKVWWVAPVAVVVAWLVIDRTRRASWRAVGAGMVGAVVVVNGPFFVAAPGAMWRMVVTDQLTRSSGTRPGTRVDALSGLRAAFPSLSSSARHAALAVIGVLLIAVAAAAWSSAVGRLAVVVLATQLAVLALAPTYFSYYAAFIAGPAAVVVGSAAQPRLERLDRARAGVVAFAVATFATLTAASLTNVRTAVTPFPGASLASRTGGLRCVMADSPMALIEVDALSRGLAHGCPNWVDVSGRTYDVDAASNPSRPANVKWQQDISRYLQSGDAYLIIRPLTGLSPATSGALEHHRVLVQLAGVRVYAP